MTDQRTTLLEAQHREADIIIAVLYEELKAKGIDTRGATMANNYLQSIGYVKTPLKKRKQP